MSASTDACTICHMEDAHKMGCPNRPGYGTRLIMSTNLPEKTND